MKLSKQQEETLSFFKKYAKKWNEKARLISYDKINITQQRNDYVLRVIKKRKKTNVMLDVGCGCGELVNEIARKGINAIGIDFSEEMIQIAKESSKKDNIKLAEFICDSIFNYDFNNKKFDLICANGFIEYISYKELHQFLDFAYESLNPDGSLVLGSRNRLFNLFSMNKFTINEIKEGSAELLLNETINLMMKTNLDDLINLETPNLQSTKLKQEKTGVDVSIRFQYTPVQLIKLLDKKKFDTIHISPIHIHGVIPKFKDKYPKIHANISNFLHEYAYENISLLPNASSFMIHGKRR